MRLNRAATGGMRVAVRMGWGGPGGRVQVTQHRQLSRLTESRENTTECSPKSMNCFMDSGDGENLEKRSTCFGIPRTEPFFHRNWPNFIFSPPPTTATKGPVSPRHVQAPRMLKLTLSLVAFPQHRLFKLPLGCAWLESRSLRPSRDKLLDVLQMQPRATCGDGPRRLLLVGGGRGHGALGQWESRDEEESRPDPLVLLLGLFKPHYCSI